MTKVWDNSLDFEPFELFIVLKLFRWTVPGFMLAPTVMKIHLQMSFGSSFHSWIYGICQVPHARYYTLEKRSYVCTKAENHIFFSAETNKVFHFLWKKENQTICCLTDWCFAQMTRFTFTVVYCYVSSSSDDTTQQTDLNNLVVKTLVLWLCVLDSSNLA